MGRWTAGIASLLVLGGLMGFGTGRGEAPRFEEPETLAPGLVATYRIDLEAAPVATRIEPLPRHSWGHARPDPRIPIGPFQATWSGWLNVRESGFHRFHKQGSGSVVLRLDGREVSEPIELRAGLVSIEIEYRHERGLASIGVEWEPPGSMREPLPSQALFHDPTRSMPSDLFEQGRRLADRLGCANCHRLLDLPSHPRLGPDLEGVAHGVDPSWLRDWLIDPARLRSNASMPAFGDHGVSETEAADILAFLGQLTVPRPPGAELQMALNVADPERGRLLFRSTGCLACHHRADEGIGGEPEGRSGPDLTGLGAKRDAGSIAGLLARPSAKAAPRHRPDLGLDADTAAHLGAYLASEADGVGKPHLGGDADRGRRLVATYRCGACHAIPGIEPHATARALGPESDPLRGCLADAERTPDTPRYTLSPEERGSLRALVAALPAEPSPTTATSRGEDSMRRLNCLGCHTREGRGGEALATRLADLLAKDSDLGGLKGTLMPPDLSSVGAKLRPEMLDQAIRGLAPTARPWLSVKMPAFDFEPGEAEAIAAFLIASDACGPGGEAELSSILTAESGAELIGQRGFGCVSCHVIAGRVPPGGEPETLGPDLALAHRRMDHAYFRRWISDPQRILPGTPMPQFFQPTHGHPGSLDDQLDAIWRLLGQPGFESLVAEGTREIRQASRDRAEVVRDVVVFADGPIESRFVPRGVAIGLPNDHSLLFDADRLAWVSWWDGGFASRTKNGRLWEWHPEGRRLWRDDARTSPVMFESEDGELHGPTEVRERFGRFAGLRFEGRGVVLTYVLNGPDGVSVQVEETIRPEANGWSRNVRVRGMPITFRPVLVVPAEDGSDWSLRRPEPLGPGQSAIYPMEQDGPGRFHAEIRLEARPGP